MYDWVRALLDPAEIVKGQSSSAKKQITPPPKFEMPAGDTPQLSPTRTRSRRSASPSKKAGSPRKSRQTRAKDVGTPGTAAANETLQSALDVSAAATDTPSLNGTVATSVEADGEGKAAAGEKKAKSASKSKKTTRAAAKDEEKEVKVEAESDVDVVEGAETSKKAVSVEMPIIPEAPSADDTKEMIAKAKEMVQEASQAPGPASKKSTKEAKKRKTEDLSDEEEDEEALAQRTKRARVLENKLKQERVRNRALVGVTAAFALA